MGYCAWDYKGVKPVQGRAWGQHLGEACSRPGGFQRIRSGSCSSLSEYVEHLGGRLRLKGFLPGLHLLSVLAREGHCFPVCLVL